MGNLIEYIHSVRFVPFQWGAHDCLSFADRCVIEQRGHGWATEWLDGYKSARGAAVKYRRAQKTHPEYYTIIDVADDRLTSLLTLHPPFGAVVARKTEGVGIGYAFGVCVPRGACFVGVSGLEVSGYQAGDLYWGAM